MAVLDFTLNSISPLAVVVIVDYERVEYIYIYSYLIIYWTTVDGRDDPDGLLLLLLSRSQTSLHTFEVELRVKDHLHCFVFS